MEEMQQYSFKFKYWRFSDAVAALDQLAFCDELYVEKATITERFRKVDGFREKYFLLSFTMRSSFNPDGTGLMKSVKRGILRD